MEEQRQRQEAETRRAMIASEDSTPVPDTIKEGRERRCL